MRTTTTVAVVLILVAAFVTTTGGLAQEAAPSSPLLPLARLMDIGMDLEVLSRLVPLELTDAQLQTLSAIYAQSPPTPFNLEKANAIVAKLEQLRGRMIKGEKPETVMADAQGLEGQMAGAFGSIFDHRRLEDNPGVALTPQERLAWEALTPAQKARLFTGLPGGQSPARRILAIVGQLRGAEEPAWIEGRDRLVACLSAAAGAEGTPARENSKKIFVEFFNRVRGMSDADWAQQQEKLVPELTALLPPDGDLAAAVADYAPGYVHNALTQTLLHPRAAALVAEMQAARKK